MAIHCYGPQSVLSTDPRTGLSEPPRWLDETVSVAGSWTDAASVLLRRLQDLMEAASEAGIDNWDSYGAARVAAGALYFAQDVLCAIPETWPSPEVGVDPDGDVSLEWSEAPDRVLTVSIDEQGVLHYAGLFGDSKTYGTEWFLGQLPPAIVGNLERLYSVASLSASPSAA